MIEQLKQNYDGLVVELEELTAAIGETEHEAAAARAELDDLTDGEDVLRAMAEERAARNRLALLRRRQADAQTKKNQTSVALERARLAAIKGQVEQAQREIGDLVLAAYECAIEARDLVEQAQRETGMLPVDSPFDAVCRELERALGKVGGTVIPDSSQAVTVMYGKFNHTRRPIGWVQPTLPIKRQRVIEDDTAALMRRLRERDAR